ncbi:HAD family hydrolase [Candidatus Hydrogenedentota bacterium]
MNKNNRPKAILLDFYGTVVEEDDVLLDRLCREIVEASSMDIDITDVFDYWGALFLEMCCAGHGDNFRLQRDIQKDSLEQTLARFDSEIDVPRVQRELIDFLAKPVIFPKSKDVLAACNVPVCIVSNIDNAELESALEHTGLSFDMVVTSEDCRSYKPHSVLFERALSLLDMGSGEVLHVGDSIPNDVAGARAMGIETLWINRKNTVIPQNTPAPDHISSDLTGILDILKLD